ncbi:MAG: hypothetical protein GQ539_06725 [Sulfitobacter sp.]|nr:hypothetical protein [Sulfitobacter sp.]
MLEDLWGAFSEFQSNIVGLGFTLAATLIIYMFRSKVKLIYGRANNSRNVVFTPHVEDSSQSSTNEIYVEKFFLQNVGRKTATGVEFVLSSTPSDISIFQPRESEIKIVEKGNCLIKIPQIAPNELVVIDCLYINQRAAWINSVKCAECLASEVAFWTVRRFSNSFNWSAAALFLLGVAFIVQTIFALIL